MYYANYLVHFNKNHSSKDGKFTYGDGDGDGIADDHKNQKYLKNRWAIKNGYQNKDGTLTAKAEKARSTKEKYVEKANKFDKLYEDIASKNEELENYDDWEDIKYFAESARELGFDTDELVKAYKDSEKFYNKNEKTINDMYQLERKMLDIDPNFSKMTTRELYDRSEHTSDVGGTFIAAFMGFPTLTALSLASSVGSGVELARYDIERRKQQKGDKE